MAVDWNRYRDTVNRLINKYGRPLTFINESGPALATKPLGAPAAPLVVSNIMGVYVRPSGYIKLGESDYMDPGMWPEAEKIALVLPSRVHDYTKFTKVRDTDGLEYKIFKTEMLQPGPVPLLVYIGMRQ